MKGIRVIGYGLAMLLCSCGGTAPQQPSQRKGQAPSVDTTQLALMELNMQLARAADEAVMKAAMEQEESYALYEAGAWMHLSDRGDETLPQPEPGKDCTVRMRVYTLDGQQLEDIETVCSVGRNELPVAVDENIRELHPGAKARMYIPWYTAFGQQGSAHVPPYENVIIELELR